MQCKQTLFMSLALAGKQTPDLPLSAGKLRNKLSFLFILLLQHCGCPLTETRHFKPTVSQTIFENLE